MIVIIDYSMGNLRSVQKGLEKCGFNARISDDPRVVEKADKPLLPGGGAFRNCMSNLQNGGFIEPIRRHIEAGRPYLGICLGLQVLFSESRELDTHRGLDIIPGKVIRFPEAMKANGEMLKVPHMG